MCAYRSNPITLKYLRFCTLSINRQRAILNQHQSFDLHLGSGEIGENCASLGKPSRSEQIFPKMGSQPSGGGNPILQLVQQKKSLTLIVVC